MAPLQEAAHPVAPTGLEASFAFEDAAELAVAVVEYGLVGAIDQAWQAGHAQHECTQGSPSCAGLMNLCRLPDTASGSVQIAGGSSAVLIGLLLPPVALPPFLAPARDVPQTREALRRAELCRRPRWRHLMQASAVLAASGSPAGSVSLHEAVLNYARQLHAVSLLPLRPPRGRGFGRGLLRAAARAAGAGLFIWAVLGRGGWRPAAPAAPRRGRAAAAGVRRGVGALLGRVGLSSGGSGGGQGGSAATAGGAAGAVGPQVAGGQQAGEPRPGALRRFGAWLANGVLNAAGRASRPVAQVIADRASTRAKGAVAERLGVF
jgi:hypothetical protein